MDPYRELSENERKRLLADLDRAAKELKGSPGQRKPSGPQTGKTYREKIHGGKSSASGRQAEAPGALTGEDPLLPGPYPYPRPPYLTRVRIDRYAFSNGFEICGFGQFLRSMLHFGRRQRDPVNQRFLRTLLIDDPRAADPSGYSLSRVVLELKHEADQLLGSDSRLNRATDEQRGVRGELIRELFYWEPFGYRLLEIYGRVDRHLLEAAESLRYRYTRHRPVDAFDLAGIVKGVYRLSLQVDASFPVIGERLKALSELFVSFFKRLSSGEQRIRQIKKRIDSTVDDFLSCYSRLKWFAWQLYPVLLKLLNRFQEEEQAHLIVEEIYRFIDLDKERVLKPGPQLKKPEEHLQREERIRTALTAKEEPPAREDDAAERIDTRIGMEEVHRDLLMVLSRAFPGSGIERIAQGDYSSLLWFHQKIFDKELPRRSLMNPLMSSPMNSKTELAALLGKLAVVDPLAPVILLYEIISRLLACLETDSLRALSKGPAGTLRDRVLEIREAWLLARERILKRYLQEIDYYHKEAKSNQAEQGRRFLEGAAGRKTVEMVNQIRNHVIQGYGHVVLGMSRNDYFGCLPLYLLNQNLIELLGELTAERQLRIGKRSIFPQILEQGDIVVPRNDPVARQINAYIETVPRNQWILADERSESQRLFLEILHGLANLLQLFLTHRGPRLEPGGEVVLAGARERKIRERIDLDKSSLRVQAPMQPQGIDALTGLLSQQEYLRLMPEFFTEIRKSGGNLSLLVIDLDHLKAVNLAKGPELGDQILKITARVVRSAMRREDLAARIGSEELLVCLRGDYRAAVSQAGRIHSLVAQRLSQQYPSAWEEIRLIMADKEYREEKRRNPALGERPEDYLKQWQNRPLGTVSVGVAQCLGKGLTDPCVNENQALARANKMLYLAKESGRDRVVVMVDALRTPLLHSEFLSYRAFLSSGPEVDPLEFIRSRAVEGQPLTFSDFPHAKYSRDV